MTRMDPLKACWICHSRNQSESSDAKPISFFTAIRLLQQDGSNSPEVEIAKMLTCIFDLKFPPGANVISCSPCACKLVSLYNLRLQFLKNVHPQAMLQPYISEMIQKTTVLSSPRIQETPTPVTKIEVDLDIDEPDSEVEMKPDMLLMEDEEEAPEHELQQGEFNSEPSSSDFDKHASSAAPPLPPLHAPKMQIPTALVEALIPPNTRPGSFVKIQLLQPIPTPSPTPAQPAPFPATPTRVVRARIQRKKPKLIHLKKTLDHLRLTGSCNRKNCTTPEFQKVRRSDIYSHLLNVHGESDPEKNISFNCSKCLKPMPSDPSLTYVYDEHFITFHGNSNPVPENLPNFPRLLSKCGLKFQITFTTIPGRRNKRHKPQKRDITCTLCNKILNTKSPITTMRLHMEMCHGQEPKYSCDICGKPIVHPYNVIIHRREHLNAEERKNEPKRRKNFDKVNCDICGANLYADGLEKHKANIHPPNGQKKVFFCKLCDFSCLGAQTFIMHKKDFHSSDNPVRFYCSRCNQGFVRKLQLREHGLICCDENERPFPCDICPKRFKIKPSLGLHLMDYHEMPREQVREKLYPGLPMPDWWGAPRAPTSRAKKRKKNQPDATETTEPEETEETTLTPTPSTVKRTSSRLRKKPAKVNC